jgi:hypothetical protein
MVNQDPQPEIYQTSHEFDYTGALIAINTMRSVDIFTYQANNEEFRLYAMKVEIDCMFNIASALDTTVGGLTGSGLPTVGAGLVNDVYTGVEASSTSGDGIGALFSITVALTEATIATATTAGSGYKAGDTITFLGTLFGGATPAGDVVLTLVAGDLVDSVAPDYAECCCCTVLPANLTAATTIADAKYSPDNANAASFGGMDFNIGVRVGGQLIPSTTFDASTIFCKSSKTMAFTTPVIVLFKQPFQIEVSNATALAALASYGKRRVRITLIGELGIQKQY